MENLDTVKTWSDVLENIKVNVSPGVFSTWFSQTYLSSLKKNGDHFLAEIGCKSWFAKNTIENRYHGLVQDSLQSFLNLSCDVTFAVKENPNKSTQNSEQVSPLFETSKNSDLEIRDAVIRAGLRPSFTFQNFAVSSSNQMAWAAAEAVSTDLGKAYNPLFIYGGVGVGKTHLMSSVGHIALQKDVSLPVVCCTGEQFTNDIVEGIRNKSTQAVRNKYRKLKLLLVDDIQFIAGKDTVQEEFFHTFNALVSAGSQVILTSDRPPSEISKLEERLRSRFEAGLIVDISQPDFELRCAITQIKSKDRGMELSMDLIQLIAGNIEAPRQIEGFLVKLSSYALVNHQEITPELIQSLLNKKEGDDIQVIKASPINVISAVSKYYTLGKKQLLGTSRARPVARPRQILMYLLRMDLRLPLEEVGRLIGGKDHTTVMHAVNKIQALASTDVQIRGDIAGIKKML